VNDLTFETDFYSDNLGRIWRCVAIPKERRMVCREEHSFTVASFETFKKWGWKRTPQAHATPLSTGGSDAG
jgi:hypothetical protein